MDMLDRTELVARARWLEAENRLYPALLIDPDRYGRALAQIRAVVEELRTRCHDLSDLLAAETSAEDILAAVCPEGRWLPTDLLIQVACAMRAREIAAARTEPA
jgi:hypothetical protein